jgi:hypothetical protein
MLSGHFLFYPAEGLFSLGAHIDISWVDWAYKSCVVDSAAIYIMVVKFRNTICPPPPQLSLHRRGALSNISNRTRSVYSRKNPKSSLYCEVSMGAHCTMHIFNRFCVCARIWFHISLLKNKFSFYKINKLKCDTLLLKNKFCFCIFESRSKLMMSY